MVDVEVIAIEGVVDEFFSPFFKISVFDRFDCFLMRFLNCLFVRCSKS